MSLGNMTPPKEYSKLSVTDPKEVEIHKLPDKEFKIIVLKLRELQENIDWQFNKIKERVPEQNELSKQIKH